MAKKSNRGFYLAGPMAQTQFFQFPYEQVLNTNLRLEKARTEAMTSNLQFNQELDAVSTIPGTEDIEQTLTAPFKQKMKDIVDKYGGDMGRAQSELQNVYYDYYMNMNNGIKQLKNADAQYQATRKGIMDGVAKDSWNSSTGMAKLQQQTEAYNEQLAAWNAGEGPLPTGNVFGAMPVKEPDFHKDMMQIIDKIKPEQIVEMGLVPDPSTGGYTNAKKTVKYSSAEARQLAAASYLQNSREYTDWANEQADLGLGPGGSYNPEVHGDIYDLGTQLNPLLNPLHPLDMGIAEQQKAFAGVETDEEYEAIRKRMSDAYKNSIYQDVKTLMDNGMSQEQAERVLAENKFKEIQSSSLIAGISQQAQLGAFTQESMTNVGSGSGSSSSNENKGTSGGFPFVGEGRAVDLNVISSDDQYRAADIIANNEANKGNMPHGKYVVHQNIMKQAAKNVGLSEEDLEEIEGGNYGAAAFPGGIGASGVAYEQWKKSEKGQQWLAKKEKQDKLYAEADRLQNQVINPMFNVIPPGNAYNMLNDNLLTTGTNIDTQLDLISIGGEAAGKGDKESFNQNQNIEVKSVSMRPFVDENGKVKYMVKGTYGGTDAKTEFEAFLNDPTTTRAVLETFNMTSTSPYDEDLAYLSHSGTVSQPKQWGNDDRFKDVAVHFDQPRNEDENSPDFGKPEGLPVYSLVQYDPETNLAAEDASGNPIVLSDTNGKPYQRNNYRAMTQMVDATMSQLTSDPLTANTNITAQAKQAREQVADGILNLSTGNISATDLIKLQYLLSDYPAKAGGEFLPSKAPKGAIRNPQWEGSLDQFHNLQPGAAAPSAVTYSKTPFEFAQAWLGYEEGSNTQNKVLSSAIKKYAGINIDPSQTPWCSAFANAVINAFGYEGTGKLNARSWLNWGKDVGELGDAQEGDLVVFKRGANVNEGHVGFYAGLNKNGNPLVLGGNQGPDGAVSVVAYKKDNLLGIRRAE